ncbi:MAG: OsmC family protein [Parafilimonas sp.]
MTATVIWKEGLLFKGESNNHWVNVDTTVDGGGSNTGMNPKQLLLVSICGCTGMDVVGILKKMKVPYTQLTIIAEAEQTHDDPKVFKWVNLIYKTDVNENDLDKLKKAIELSQTKYCGVSIMIKKHCPINYTIELI